MAELKRLVVKAEPWQLFFVFTGAMLFYGIVPDEQHVLKIIASVLLAVVLFGWFLILGTSLNENLPEDEQKPDTLFTISCFYGILLVCLSAVLKNVPIEDIAEYAIVLVILFGISFFYMIYFVSVLFASNQDHYTDREKLTAEVIFILFIVFVFGVLILQSRVRRFFK